MNFYLLVAIATFAAAPLPSLGQGTADCKESSASASEVFNEFLRSDLAAQWSEGAFGDLNAISKNSFFECTRGAGEAGFSILVSSDGKSARSLGFASRNGLMKAIVIEVTELASGLVEVKLFDVSGSELGAFTVNNGTITDVQGIGGRTGCAGIYLTGMAGVGLGTLAGPVGFAVGMGVMMFSLWDAGCY